MTEQIAEYLGSALEKSNLTSEFAKFLDTCFKESDVAESLSECIYEAIETTCGICTSIQGYLSTDFVLNSMSLANTVKA